MKISEYEKLIDLTYLGGGFLPANENAEELTLRCAKGEVITFAEVTARDLKFHKCYMDLLGTIYEYLPKKFKETVPKNKFYIFVKHLKKDYRVLFKFKDGTKMVEYESIAFGNMSQKRFEEFIAEQLPFIYENIIGVYFEGEMYKNILYTIEEDYKYFLAKLKV
jgi:hypothetical protein